VECSVDNNKKVITFTQNMKEVLKVTYTLSEFDDALVKAGGWVEFADARY
jgi:hypothetical protein